MSSDFLLGIVSNVSSFANSEAMKIKNAASSAKKTTNVKNVPTAGSDKKTIARYTEEKSVFVEIEEEQHDRLPTPKRMNEEQPSRLSTSKGMVEKQQNHLPAPVRAEKEQYGMGKTQYYPDINGEIEYTEQKDYGDCYLLTALNSLSYTSAGRSAIKDAVKYNEKTGNIEVTLKLNGTNNYTYLIERNELGDDALAEGDDDVKAFELAVSAYRQQLGIKAENNFVFGETLPVLGHKNDVINGGITEETIYMITGIKGEEFFRNQYNGFTNGNPYDTLFNNVNSRLEDFEKNPDRYCATVSFLDDKVESFNNEELVKKHAYAIKSVSGDEITLVNPWDSSKTITITKEQLFDTAKRVTFTDLVVQPPLEIPVSYW